MALQANELRLGSWIQIGGNTLETYQTYKPYKVTIEILSAILEENKERPDAISSVWQPIPLSPKLLEQCGFKRGSDVVFGNTMGDVHAAKFNKGERAYVLAPHSGTSHYGGNSNYSFFYCGDGFRHALVKDKIEHVHQLQNLYFALTGKELSIETLTSMKIK